MAVHDSREWVGQRAESGLALRNLLQQLELITKGEKSFEQSLDDEAPIAYYARKGFFQEDEAIQLVATKLGLGILSLSEHSPSALYDLLDIPPASHFTAKEWQDMRAIPLTISADNAVIAMADPLDNQVLSRLRFVFGRALRVLIGREKDILNVLLRNITQEDEEAVELIVKGKRDASEETQVTATSTLPEFESGLADDDPNAAPVVRLVHKIFSRAIAAEASDLHFTPTKSGLEVKARIDGIMQNLLEVPTGFKANVLSRVKLLCGMDISERRRPQDGRLRVTSSFGTKDLRISSVPSAHGENLVARILSSDVQAASFDELGASEDLSSRLLRTLQRGCKVNLVTGPTGSGKTSTLYASLLHLHDHSRNIITLEDPIEYRIDGITQIQVNSKIQFGFAEGLRSILRQDPDVVLVGEVRDEETASISMKTAQTGHLVLSTLHTNTAAGAITRLLDLGVPSYLISSSLGSLLAQRLVRKLCPDCSKKMPKKEREASSLPSGTKIACGCEKCRDTGYKGRTAIFSFIEITEDVAEAIRLNLGEEEIERRARASGFETLEEVGLKLVENGVTSLDEVERVLGPVGAVVAGAHQETEEESRQGIFAQPKILIVEDDEDQRNIYGSIFESEMFEVITATDGKDALEKLMTQSVDAVVCDMMMPRIDGQAFVKRLRGHTETKDLPVLMLTAADSEESELTSFSGGADDFLSKTSSVNILLARVRRLVERASQQAHA